jgi:alcohol dehydrogenase class IV
VLRPALGLTVQAFTFATAGRIVVGLGRAADLPQQVAALGSRVLVVTGAHPERHAGVLDGLAAAGLHPVVHPLHGEPTVQDARAAVQAARGCQVVLGLGGGSAIDLAKAAAALTAGGDPLDHLEVVGAGRPLPGPGLPVVAVPTTAGTGAEVTANAVLTTPPGVKVSLRGPTLLPALAVVDPLLTLDCPPAVTASAGMDALTQCLEPLVSPLASPLTDGFARTGLQAAGRGLRRAWAHGDDVDARADMSLCALLGGMALANAKLGAVHGIAGVVGGRVGGPHGAVCAALLAPVVAVTVRALQQRPTGPDALARYAEAARLLTGRPDAGTPDLLDWLAETVSLLEVPGLGAYGLTAADAPAVAQAALGASSTQGHPVRLSADELAAAVTEAL